MPHRRMSRKFRIELLERRELFASDLTLLADVNSELSLQGMSVRELTKLGSDVYFVSENPTVGEELWRYNAGVPKLVKNINLGSASANIGPLTVLGDKLIFAATDQEHGNEIWVSDGTEPGTQLLKDISGGGGSSIPRSINAVGNQALFFAYGRTFNGRLWKTDGTPEGTTLVKTIESEEQTFLNTNLTSAVLGSKLFFVFDDEVHGAELWVSDGTEEGTHIAFEFADGSASIQPSRLVALGDSLLIETNDGIFASDGTFAGTTKVSGQPLSLGHARVYQNKVYFSDNANTLWVSDGTVQGTQAVKTLEGSIRGIDVTSNGLVMRIADGFPYSIFISDGTSDGTLRLDDENSRPYPSWNVFAGPTGFFFLSQRPEGSGLYFSNGTTAGTRLVRNFTFPITNSREGSVVVDGKTFLPVYGGSVDVLWVSDGTESGTNSVNEARLQTQSSIPVDEVSAGDLAYVLAFNRADAGGTSQLWRSDGTPDGTRRLLDDAFWPTQISRFGNKLAFFTAPESDRTIGFRIVKRLWTSDGSDEGTKVLFDFTEQADELVVVDSFQVGDRLYFWMNRTTQQISTGELWSTVGTTEGTVRISILPDPASPLSNSPLMLAKANGLIYFKTTHVSDLGIQSQTLWRTDGTSDGTFAIQSFSQYDYPELVGAVGNKLYFSSVTKDVFSIYATDGTAIGTVKVIDAIDDFEKAIVFQNRILIATGSGIRSYDPALGGSPTPLVSVVIRKDIGPNFTEVGEKLFFTAETLQELWVTDGSAEGTFSIRNINLSGNGAQPQELTNINGTLYFSAIDSVHGRELWKSSGTEATTELVADATGDAGDGVPKPFRAGSRVLVIATTNEYGREIYAVDKPVYTLSLMDAAIDENSPVDAVVGDLFLSNFAGLGLAFSLVGDQLDNSKFKIVGNQLLARESFNYEVDNSDRVVIQAKSAFETLFEKEVVVSINNINEGPVTGGPDVAKVDRHFTAVLNVVANDSSREGIIAPGTVTLVRQPTHGQARVLFDGKIEFTPDPLYVGIESLEYRVSDEDGLTSDPILVSLEILASFHQNPRNARDVDDDGEITPLDVLKLINDVNSNGVRTLPQRSGLSAPYFDVNGDGEIGPLDILIVINFINSHPENGEGESRGSESDAHDVIFQMLDWESIKPSRRYRFT